MLTATERTSVEAQTIMAVGAHIGDMDLAAGPLLAQNVLGGGRSVLVALTPGERGHPRMSISDYQAQKFEETHALATEIGAEVEVFSDLSDGFLYASDEVCERLAMLIRTHRPTMLLAHWRHSIHTDHENACRITERARFLAGLPGWRVDEAERHGVAQLLYAENWEDSAGFRADRFVEVSAAAHERWLAGIRQHAFARGETYGFRYIDYYDAQLIMRGCLAGVERAVALGTDPEATAALTEIEL